MDSPPPSMRKNKSVKIKKCKVMKSKIKMKMLGVVIVLLGMLVGSSVMAQVSTIELDGFEIHQEVYEGKSVVVLNFSIATPLKLYKDSSYYAYTADNSYYASAVLNQDVYTTETIISFHLDSEAYSEFLIKGMGAIDLGNGNIHYYDEQEKEVFNTFLALKSTALRVGETYEEE